MITICSTIKQTEKQQMMHPAFKAIHWVYYINASGCKQFIWTGFKQIKIIAHINRLQPFILKKLFSKSNESFVFSAFRFSGAHGMTL